MNIFKGTLDTRQQNGVIASINQFDNATLELKIVTDGQIDNVWDEPRFELIGMKRDNNPVREVDQDHFTILSKEEHKVRIELKEQFLTCRGTVKMQLIIKDGGRESTTIFYLLVGQSLDRDIIESRVDVKVLDDLETYIQTGREVIYDAQAIVTDLKDEMSEFNASSSEKEAERQASELNRASKELNRIDNEETRVTNEHDRVTNEEDRVTNEEERVANEQDRVTNEQNRRLAENTRIAQERARQDAELQRNSIFEENETIRKDGEKKRITNENEREKKFSTWEERETTRLRSEENRIIQEQVRVANEETRQRHEQTRQNQEDYRQRTYTQFNEAEASRVNKELQRQTAEENRVAAEANRQNSYADRENERDRQYAESEKTRNDAFEQNEVNRQSEYTTAERQRVESEELRKSRERERETAESQRATTERERVNAEQKRAADFNREIENIQNTMNQAVSNVNGAIDTANSTMEGIEQRAEECLPVIEQSSNEIERARVDYIGNQHSSIKKANDANVDWLLGEVNTAHYEGQHITALDTLEGRAKSATLKGQTLVNLVPKKIIDHIASSDWDGYCCLVQNSKQSFDQWRALQDLKPNTKYYISCYVETFEDANNKDYCLNNPSVESIFEDSMIINGVGRYQWLSTTKSELTDEIFIVLRSQNAHARGAIKIRDIMIIEYQEGMKNWDIPYFEGIQSVKMPVLTTSNEDGTKTNILTVNEDVTLRSNGDICDELNLLTGQLTQRIGEDGVVLSQEVVKTVDLSDNHVYSYKDVTHYDCSSAEGSLVPTLSIDVPTNLPAVVTRQRVTIQELEKENVALKNVIEETANSSVNGDLELMSSQFELDFRLFEIEMNLDMPMMAMMRGVKSMAMTVYQQAKTLILAGKYEREGMEYKLNRYKAAGRITVEEYEELIALMDARELVD
ncbi:hypothetical protein [Turicibacter sp. GALT-G1]|uniref:hypothetical protein n=1 Tax=Turicibacter sp. GALT-G1 TaxID=2951140 RepID=UPI0021D4D1EE|nr:hypothetical protein [Turicibacter sp. GALT-G1]MCU7205945.1 hypothetical protein [Turicibacter sp. GALT-G1]